MSAPRTISTAWILCGVLAGALLGFYLPMPGDALVAITWVALGVMVFLVVLSLPLVSFGKAIQTPRVLLALLVVNLIIVPLIAFILSRVVWQLPELQIGLLLVLLAPGVALSLNTAVAAGGDLDSVLASTPLLLVGQLFVVPLYAIGLSGGVLGFSDLPPTFVVIASVIIGPSLLAFFLQALGTPLPGVIRFRLGLARLAIPSIALAVGLVVWSRLPDQLGVVEELYRLVPLFFSFLVLIAPLALLTGILSGLTQAQKRAVMIVGAGRGGVIMLPIAMALNSDLWGLVPLVVVVQLTLEVLGLMVFRSIVPEIVPTWGR
jgi:ACR3 family arsenite efflux pump ArsB